MPPLSKRDLERVEELYRSFMSQCDGKNRADKMVWGTLNESLIHFIIRAVPNMGSVDIDQVFQSFGKNVAIVSIKRMGKNWPNEAEILFYEKISEFLQIPVYWVFFADSWHEFRIFRTKDLRSVPIHVFNRDEFMKWCEDVSNERLVGVIGETDD